MAQKQRQQPEEEARKRLSKPQLEKVEKEIQTELARGNLLDANSLFFKKIPEGQRRELWTKLQPKMLEAGVKSLDELDRS